jgi:SAM-dependent methyltransferase
VGSLTRVVTSQLAGPHGPFARWVTQGMLRANADTNRWVADSLELTGTEDVLELGCGPGHLLGLVASRLDTGRVVGVDHSSEATTVARDRLNGHGDGVEIVTADVERGLAFPDASFDRVVAVHVVYFWDDPSAVLREVRRVLRPGGRVVLGFSAEARPRWLSRAFEADGHHLHRPVEVQALVCGAGFRDVRLHQVPDSEHAVVGVANGP